MNKRHVMARNCASQVAAYQKQRKAKRALRRRALAEEKRDTVELVVIIGISILVLTVILAGVVPRRPPLTSLPQAKKSLPLLVL
jgi:hypothetical protein